MLEFFCTLFADQAAGGGAGGEHAAQSGLRAEVVHVRGTTWKGRGGGDLLPEAEAGRLGQPQALHRLGFLLSHLYRAFPPLAPLC